MIRIADDQHRFVLTNHHMVIEGRSLPILLGECSPAIPGSAACGVPYRRFVSWLAGRDLDAARTDGVRCWPALTPPPWSPRRIGWARATGVERFG